MGPLQVSRAGFAIATAGSLVWGNKATGIKNREIGGALALGGCRVMMPYINQPIVGVCSFDNDRAEVWLGQSIWGGGDVEMFLPSDK
jgi:hypothetical protein